MFFNKKIYSLKLVALFISLFANAQDFLNDAQHMFFDESMHERRIGIEIEFSGLSDATIQQIIEKVFDARVSQTLPQGEIQFDSKFGKIAMKIEGRAWRFESDQEKYREQLEKDKKEAPREIVLPPMTYKDIKTIQELGDALKEAGAIGTTPHDGVSTQVNVEMRNLLDSQQNVNHLIDLLRVYYLDEHLEQIQKRIKVPKIRHEYVGNLSDGFMKKLKDVSYRPTARQLFDDYFYRQSLELLGYSNAWTMDIRFARRVLLEREGESAIVPAIVKMQKLRVSSLLLKAFPEDDLAKRITSSRWARAMPLVEFRQFNNDFNIKRVVEYCLGIISSVERYGAYQHDRLVSKITGIDPRDLEQLRQYRAKKRDQYIVRYALYDPVEYYLEEQNSNNPNILWIQLSPYRVGNRPLVIDGESIVYHRRHIHRSTLLGKYNPGLENALIQQVLENKLFEAEIFAKYVSGAMPRSINLTDIVTLNKKAPHVNIKNLLSALREHFPEGWVMKGAWDLSTERTFISDKIDLYAEIQKYRNGFDEFLEKTEKEMKGEDPEAIIKALKKHPGYLGWKICQMLERPYLVFFQERLNIAREFRVEVHGGKVLSNGSTIDRYVYELEKTPRQNDKSRAEVRAVEAFVQNVIEQLPKALQVLPYGFDVALTASGSFAIIESNPGGNSSFLEEYPASMKALNHYLQSYPELVKKGVIQVMSQVEQMNWINEHFLELGIKKELHYPGFQFLRNDIIDSDYKRMDDAAPRKRCQFLLASKDDRAA